MVFCLIFFAADREISDLLDEDLEYYEPVILRHNNIGHFFLATEKLARTYRIRDPLWYNTETLDQTVTVQDHAQPYDNYKRDYNNHYDGLRRFYALGTYDARPVHYASIGFTIASPAELLITDSQGNKLGKDPINNIEYTEIASGTYTTEGIGDPSNPGQPYHRTKSIWIPNPASGDYRLTVIGTGQGDYTLFSVISDEEGNSNSSAFTGSTMANQTTGYGLNYDSEDISESEIVLSAIDIVPPEANIYFDFEQNDIIVKGTDNITATPTVNEKIGCAKKIMKRCLLKEYVYTIADESGNTTKLWLTKTGHKHKIVARHKHKIVARLEKIQYNEDEPVKMSAWLDYVWTKDKNNNNIKFLSQDIGSHKGFFLKALYNQKKDKTIIFGRDWRLKDKIKEIKPGIVIIKLFTHAGNSNYDF